MKASLRQVSEELNAPARVLVVEDDLLNRMFICAVLRDRNYVVEEVEDGAHVLAATRRFEPDLITMDINIPNISGLELIEDLKADPMLRHIPVLAVTAYVGQGEESRIREAGASDFMAKPLSIKPFLAAVDNLLEKHASQAI
jgi:two-component system cell cycle response regulator DivK